MQKTALITGSSRGIGLGIAKALARDGYALAINGMRPQSAVEEILDSLRKMTPRVIYTQGNIGSAKDRERMVLETLQAFGTIEVLINNAGVAPLERLDILQTTEASYDRVMDINLKGAFFLAQRVANQMIADQKKYPDLQPCIINISSISATIASINRGEYCLSKAGMSMMTQLLAVRLGEENIPVYEIRPGVTATDMTGPVKAKYDKLIEEGLTIQKRWGYPEDVGKAVSALVEGAFPYSTGQVIMIDGGLTIPRL